MPERARFYRLFRFGIVGGCATLVYFSLAWWLSVSLEIQATVASFAAYSVATLYSYIAHKFFTFRSNNNHSRELPQFLALTLIGYIFASALPAIFTTWLEWHAGYALAFTCVLIPLINFIGMEKFVFRSDN